MILTLFIIPITTLILNLIIFSYFNTPLLLTSKLSSTLKDLTGNVYCFAKHVTTASFFVTLFYSLYLWKFYPWIKNGSELYPNAIKIGSLNLFEINNILSLPFIILSTFVLLVSLITTWHSGVNMILFSTMMLLLEVCLVGSFSCTSLFVFLLFFEASALPIFILIAYCGSARHERIKAGYYFLFYTFYGSLALLLVLINVYSLSQINFITEVPEQGTNMTLWVLLFIAFAVKIPLFPFHIWLPYAHVEASSSASIILAALMLKLGGYGVIKFLLPLFIIETHQFLGFFAFILCIFGCIYSSLAALRQIDLKRYVAFSSVSHMSFAVAGVFTFTEIGIKGATYLILSHGLTSSALFFLVGVLSDRYHTRAVTAFSGLLASIPIFSFFLIVTSLANSGFPGTSGFIPEIEVLLGLIEGSTTIPTSIILFVLLGMFLTTNTTLLPMLRMLFGHSKALYSENSTIDLLKQEFYILFIITIFVIILGLNDILYRE